MWTGLPDRSFTIRLSLWEVVQHLLEMCSRQALSYRGERIHISSVSTDTCCKVDCNVYNALSCSNQDAEIRPRGAKIELPMICTRES